LPEAGVLHGQRLAAYGYNFFVPVALEQ